MGFPSILGMAHQLVQEAVRPGEPVIDATIGAGSDTLFLARLTGPGGTVYGFDIQPKALELARSKASASTEPLGRLELYSYSHASMLEVLPSTERGRVAAVMFNLGYLPGGDHAVITTAEHTIPALECAVRMLRPGGVLTVVVYTGHPGGAEEAEAIQAWAERLPQERLQAMCFRFLNQRNDPPYLIAVTARSREACTYPTIKTPRQWHCT